MSELGDALQFFVAGENLPAVRAKQGPYTSADIKAHGQYTPAVVHQVEFATQLPEIKLKTLKKNDLLVIQTEVQKPYMFLVERLVKEPDAEAKALGRLFLHPDTAQLMGTPPIIEEARISGASPPGSFSVYLGSIKQGMGVEIYCPLSSLGPLISEHDKGSEFQFKIPPVQSAGIKNLAALPPAEAEVIHDQVKAVAPVLRVPPKPAYREVTDWPGRKIGITLEEINDNLYMGAFTPGYGLRGRYWINPQTGALSRQGMPIPDTPTVWDAVRFYATKYERHPEERRNSRRPAAFTWWALRLDLKPPPEVVEHLRVTGLGFEPLH